MKGILKLDITINNSYEDYYLTDDSYTNKDYMLNCCIDINTPIIEINNKNKLMKKNIIEQYVILSQTKEDYENLLKIMKLYINEEFNLIENCDTIILSSEDNLIVRYLNNNPNLNNKKIIIEKKYDIKDLEYVKATYKDNPNLYLYINGNNEPITIKEFEKTVNTINSIIAEIKKYNFSPLEQTMYAYDLIRKKVYKKELETESLNISRDLTSSLLGEKIVCVGYTKIFEQILLGLGIKSSQHKLTNKIYNTPGHVLNVAYLKDSKYNIDGIYFFDLTWDSKTKNNDNSYLNSYRFFAKTKKEIDIYYQEKYLDTTFKSLDIECIYKIKEILKNKDLDKLTPSIINTINELSRFISNKELLDLFFNISLEKIQKILDIDEIINELEKYTYIFNKPIDIKILLETLYNVRKIEYYNNPEKYNFDYETISIIAYNSQWKFDENSKEYFINVLFDKVPLKAVNFKKSMQDYSNITELEKNINQIKLIKVLKNIKDKKEKD